MSIVDVSPQAEDRRAVTLVALAIRLAASASAVMAPPAPPMLAESEAARRERRACLDVADEERMHLRRAGGCIATVCLVVVALIVIALVIAHGRT